MTIEEIEEIGDALIVTRCAIGTSTLAGGISLRLFGDGLDGTEREIATVFLPRELAARLGDRLLGDAQELLLAEVTRAMGDTRPE